MEQKAELFRRTHLGQGYISKVTDYCFEWTTNPDKNGKSTKTTYMETYFWSKGE